MTIGEKIKLLRTTLKITQEELAKAAGTTKQTIHKYETGIISNIPASKIKAMADKLGTHPYYLMGWEDKYLPDDLIGRESEIKNIVSIPKTHRIPLLGAIACGEPILAAENLDGEVDIPEEINADYALRCKGDSMIEARIMDGDIVYIKQQPTVNNGEIAAVLIGDEATLKRVYISDNKLTLMPCNPKYPPFVYTDSELEQVRIIGKAVGFTSKVK